ncbi:hypothetical protein CK203_019122 [Vitis vinifera]|uniref:Uncharacterized protein n=1 Tax=Vitis vinifera TaxID=29760 RepID=A0A438J7X0_VITVI|nr:hypothetical protein CK203_019122 [Vitis vinifera]
MENHSNEARRFIQYSVKSMEAKRFTLIYLEGAAKGGDSKELFSGEMGEVSNSVLDLPSLKRWSTKAWHLKGKKGSWCLARHVLLSSCGRKFPHGCLRWLKENLAADWRLGVKRKQIACYDVAIEVSVGEQANQALLNFKGLRDSFSTEAFFIRGMENIREKYGTTMEEEMMVLLVENSLLSSDVALFAEFCTMVVVAAEDGFGHGGVSREGDKDWSSNSLPVFSNWLGMSMKGYETEILELLQKIKGYKGGEVSGWWKEEKELHFFEIRKGIKQA